MVNNIRDLDTDRRAGKRTLAVRLGRERARRLYAAMVVLAYADRRRGRGAGEAEPGCCSRWLSAPLGRPLSARSRTRTDGPSLNARAGRHRPAAGRLLAPAVGRAAAAAVSEDRAPRDRSLRASVPGAVRDRARAARPARAAAGAAVGRRRHGRARRGGAAARCAAGRRLAQIAGELDGAAVPRAGRGRADRLEPPQRADPRLRARRGLARRRWPRSRSRLLDLRRQAAGPPAWQLLGAEQRASRCRATRRSSRASREAVADNARALGGARLSRPSSSRSASTATSSRWRPCARRSAIEAAIRVDANGAWTVEQAIERAAQSSSHFGLELAEQPVATLEQMASVRGRRGVPRRCRRERRRRVEDARAAARLGACDCATVKLAKVGGVRAALDDRASSCRSTSRARSTARSASRPPATLAQALRGRLRRPCARPRDRRAVRRRRSPRASASSSAHELHAERRPGPRRRDRRARARARAALDAGGGLD